MTTQRSNSYIRQLRLNKGLTLQQLEGLTGDELLLQPESRGNCANWVLGHIIVNRYALFQQLGQSTAWNEEKRKLYEAGSNSITG